MDFFAGDHVQWRNRRSLSERRSTSHSLEINGVFFCYQVLVLAENVGGKTLDKVSDFHAKLGITRKSRAVRKCGTRHHSKLEDRLRSDLAPARRVAGGL
jgi:hypothetical protein